MYFSVECLRTIVGQTMNHHELFIVCEHVYICIYMYIYVYPIYCNQEHVTPGCFAYIPNHRTCRRLG